MASVIIQYSKYIILVLFLLYVFGAYFALGYEKHPKIQKRICLVQKIFLYAIHAMGFLCLYLKESSMEIVIFYLMQVGLFSVIFVLFQLIHKHCSVLLLNNMCMLLAIGMIILTRISIEKAFRQFVFIAIGTFAMLIIPFLFKKGTFFRNLSILYFLAGVALLAVVVVIGATSYGAKLTISIGGFSFQPSEFVKIIFVFFIASLLYKGADFKRVVITSCFSAVYVLLLVASKDLGGALLYFMAFLLMIYVASKKIIYLGIGTVGFLAAGATGYYLFSHVRTRVFVWLNPTADIDNQGYQICQSLLGIAKGGWFGFGIGEGVPKKIPVVEKDFIFSAISEEFGAIFAMAIILLCLCLFLHIIRISLQVKDKFYKLVAVGLSVLYATQVVLTIGGAIKFIPSTGVTLPLVSYGGSSMLSTMIILGIVQGLNMRRVASHSDAKNKNAVEYYVVACIFIAIFIAMIAYLTYFLGVKSEEFIMLFP